MAVEPVGFVLYMYSRGWTVAFGDDSNTPTSIFPYTREFDKTLQNINDGVIPLALLDILVSCCQRAWAAYLPCEIRDYRLCNWDTSLWQSHRMMLPAVSHHRLRHSLATRLALVQLVKDQDERHAALPWSESDWISVEAKLLRAESVALNLKPECRFEELRLAYYNKHKLRLYGSPRLKFPKSALAVSTLNSQQENNHRLLTLTALLKQHRPSVQQAPVDSEPITDWLASCHELPFEYHPDAYLVDSADGEATHWGDVDHAMQVDETAASVGPSLLARPKTHASCIQAIKQQRVKLMEFSGSVDVGPALLTLEDTGVGPRLPSFLKGTIMRQLEDDAIDLPTKKAKRTGNQLARGSIVEVQRISNAQPEYQICVRDGWELSFDQSLSFPTPDWESAVKFCNEFKRHAINVEGRHIVRDEEMSFRDGKAQSLTATSSAPPATPSLYEGVRPISPKTGLEEPTISHARTTPQQAQRNFESRMRQANSRPTTPTALGTPSGSTSSIKQQPRSTSNSPATSARGSPHLLSKPTTAGRSSLSTATSLQTQASHELPALVPGVELARFLATGLISTGLDAGKRVFQVAPTSSSGSLATTAPKAQTKPQLSTFAGYQTTRPSTYSRSYASGSYVPTAVPQRAYMYGPSTQGARPYAGQQLYRSSPYYTPTTTLGYLQPGQVYSQALPTNPQAQQPQPSQSTTIRRQPSPRLAANKK
eukprot:m.50597 g.50597  ORF g.50597 m.50597 type:complete len:709 (-) comp13438_c0_seq1:120-2246(-)